MNHHDEGDRPVRDVVCGMLLSRKTAVTACARDGPAFYSCSDVCQDAFELDPDRYVERRRRWARGRSQARSA